MAKKTKHGDILVIADTQVTPTANIRHIQALARYIWKHRPSVVVHIGDHWDFESLSSYASPMEREGRRLYDDLLAGARALDIVTDYLKIKNQKAKSKVYKPELHFLMGNHEDRLNRFIDNHPHMDGMIDLKEMIELAGWQVHDFNDPYWHNGVCFSHYMSNPQSGRPVGGGIENKLNKFPHSFVHGHQQQYQFGRRQNLEGRPHFGICAGSFYIHDEAYRGANNTEIRGFVHLKAFTNRYQFADYDADFVSLERLLESY